MRVLVAYSERTVKRHGTRRELLATVMLAVLVLLAACASDPEPTTGATSDAPRPGGTLTFALATEGDCLDPHVSPADVTAVIQRNVFDSLVAQTPAGKIVPWLATSWKVNGDATEFTFTLRDGVTFHDGVPFDAAAVKANFDHIVAKSTRSQYAVALLGSYAATDVVDARTVRVSFTKPYAAFLAAAATTYLGMQSPRQLTGAADTLCSGGPASVGTGPFRFTEYVKGSRAVFSRNPAYAWAPEGARHNGAAYLDQLVIRFLPEDATRVAALRNGEVLAVDGLPAPNVADLEKVDALHLLKIAPQNANYSIYFNTRREPLADQRVRAAVQRAVDLDTIVKTVYFGQYSRAWSNLAPDNVAYDRSLEGRVRYSPDEANHLLDEAGWKTRDGAGYRVKDGRRLVLEWPYVGAFNREQRLVVSEAVQADLKKVGIEVNLYSLDSGAYTAQRNAGGYDLIAFSWGKSDPDLLRQIYASGQTFNAGGVNGSGIHSAEVDGWLAEGAASTDPAVRRSAYAKVQNYVVDNAFTLPVYVFTRAVGASTRVHDITFDPDAFPLFHDTWLG
ncbi:extracellular solute-binding protein family 5 [Candidatus Protofrankia californiensis]|uniref:Extracellular solute-binding protein family 5 n=1 Tax=Candidatus Protofrankia californiensis TaxID=1839754 RepID=A0A1C3NYF8_9ACTN|nr:extracellular solute-binding protein family 5 [Candidatus Protofrankia californiensis]